MLNSVRIARRALAGAIGIAGAVFVGTAGTAAADPPPNCTAADLAGVTAGVSAATSVYLFTHPDVNAFLTGLKDQPKDQIRAQFADYVAANPQLQADLQGIRQPMVDFRNRCQ